MHGCTHERIEKLKPIPSFRSSSSSSSFFVNPIQHEISLKFVPPLHLLLFLLISSPRTHAARRIQKFGPGSIDQITESDSVDTLGFQSSRNYSPLFQGGRAKFQPGFDASNIRLRLSTLSWSYVRRYICIVYTYTCVWKNYIHIIYIYILYFRICNESCVAPFTVMVTFYPRNWAET